MLNKHLLREDIYKGLYDILTKQAKKATNGDEDEKPEIVIKRIVDEMATVIANSVEKYVKAGDVTIGAENISVTLPTGTAIVVPLKPAKLV